MNDDATTTDGRDEPDDALRWALADEFGPSSPAHDDAVFAAAREASRNIRARRRRRRSAWLLPAAAALVGVFLVPLFYQATPPAPVTRGPTDGIVPAHRATLDTPPARFAWPAVPEARTYRIELLDAAAEPLWQSEPTTMAELDAGDAGNAMQDTGSYLWIVSAETATGTVELGPYWFRLER